MKKTSLTLLVILAFIALPLGRVAADHSIDEGEASHAKTHSATVTLGTAESAQIKQMQALITLLRQLLSILQQQGGHSHDDASNDDHDDANHDEDESNDDHDDSNDDEDSEEVDEVEVTLNEEEDEAEAVVTFEDGDTETFSFDTTDRNDIIDELADELNMDREDVDDLIEFVDLADEVEDISVEFDGGDSEVTVEFADGTEDSFSLDTTKHNEVIEGIAEELDIDEDTVRDLISFEDGELEIEVEIEDGEASVRISYEDDSHQSFTLDLTDENEIIAEIVDRTGLSEDEVSEVIDITISN